VLAQVIKLVVTVVAVTAIVAVVNKLVDVVVFEITNDCVVAIVPALCVADTAMGSKF
jgi:hypothetical protein